MAKKMPLGARVLLSIGGTLAYLAMAVAGEGGLARYVAHPALVALAVATVVVGFVALSAGGNVSPGIREERSNRWVLIPFTVLGLALGFVPAWTDRLGLGTLDGETLRWCGSIVAVVGFALRIGPVFVLGDRFSGLVAIQPGHTLVTTGIYGRIRHPSYLGIVVSGIGWSLAFRSGVGVLITALLIPPLVARMNAEERLLHDHFGDEYDAYRARTARFIPGLY